MIIYATLTIGGGGGYVIVYPRCWKFMQRFTLRVDIQRRWSFLKLIVDGAAWLQRSGAEVVFLSSAAQPHFCRSSAIYPSFRTAAPRSPLGPMLSSRRGTYFSSPASAENALVLATFFNARHKWLGIVFALFGFCSEQIRSSAFFSFCRTDVPGRRVRPGKSYTQRMRLSARPRSRQSTHHSITILL